LIGIGKTSTGEQIAAKRPLKEGRYFVTLDGVLPSHIILVLVVKEYLYMSIVKEFRESFYGGGGEASKQ